MPELNLDLIETVADIVFILVFLLIAYLFWDYFKQKKNDEARLIANRISQSRNSRMAKKEKGQKDLYQKSSEKFGESQSPKNSQKEETYQTASKNSSFSDPDSLIEEIEVAVEDEKQNVNVLEETQEGRGALLEATKTEAVNSLNSENENSRIESSSQAKFVGDWIIVGGKSIGKSHRENGVPCQDNFFLSPINENSGIAVVCDGAGSAKNSQIGSKFVSERVALIFSKILESEIGLDKLESVNSEEWADWAKTGLYQARLDLEEFAIQENYTLSSLSCTVIVVIYHDKGILVTHIGDGRAGYLSLEKGWQPLITPYKGEEANETVFITSKIWNEKDIDLFLESKVINEEYSGFTLMSDGFETHSYSCSIFDEDSKTWSDPNLPYSKFFDPLVEGLKEMRESGLTPDEIGGKWVEFIKSGTKGITNEPDDKTLILAVFEK